MDELVVRNPDRDGEHGRNSLAFDLRVPVLPEVFAAELHALLNASDAPPGLVFEFAPGGETGTLWTLDNSVQFDHIKQVLAKHTGERPVVDDDTFVQDILGRPDDPLTAHEISRSIRILLSRTSQE